MVKKDYTHRTFRSPELAYLRMFVFPYRKLVLHNLAAAPDAKVIRLIFNAAYKPRK